MAIEINVNFDAKQKIEEIKKAQKLALERALADAATEIVTRTRGQRDARGGSFKPLNKIYQRYKIKSGRSGVPDLTYRGSMLASITSKVEELGTQLIGKIFFTSAKEAEKARDNMKYRKFFELSADQINKIINKLQGR